MTQVSQQPADITPATIADPLGWEEDQDYTLRAQLGLRPIVFKSYDRTADPRPCPSWCWVGQTPDESHEVDHRHPQDAVHTMAVSPAIASECYLGEWHRGGSGSPALVTTATIEPRLEQRGQANPLIKVALRGGTGADRCTHCATDGYDDEALRLSLTDARELVTVLNYLLQLAER